MTRFGLALVLAVASTACVSKVRYDDCLADAARVRADADVAQRQAAARIQDLQQQIAQAQATIQDREGRLNDLSTSAHNLQARLDEATAINQQLRAELTRLGTDVDKMLAERGTLSKALDDARVRLDELRKAQAVAAARLQLFRDFEQRFKPLIDSGQLRVEARRGELVMNVEGDLLFDEGRADLRSAGKGALMEIARAIETTSPPASGRRFLVTADVDGSEKEKSKDRRHPPPSTWELTAERAVAVVEYLVSLGVPPTSLTAAAAGSYDPIAPAALAETPDGRARDRRIEIALMPTADATGLTMPNVPSTAAPPSTAH